MARSDAVSQREAPTAGHQTEPLTEIEGKILDFMVQYLRDNTYQPSIREIGERFGIKSTKTVSEHLQALADKGCLERDPSRSRGVKILGVDLNADTVAVPCFSRMPLEGVSKEIEGVVSVDRQLGGRAGSFMVRAGAGDLAVLGVAEGDLVLLEPATIDEVEDGSVVVAEVGDSSAFHRVAKNGKGVHLEALEPGGETTLVEDGDDLRLIGRVTGFYRRMDEVGSLNLTPH
ncbi:MAG: transcriptional repressor LexA [Gemmatimonadota bacterium]|nr:transcriptional repressor LexA [Gemmatimonadota bacterium]